MTSLKDNKAKLQKKKKGEMVAFFFFFFANNDAGYLINYCWFFQMFHSHPNSYSEPQDLSDVRTQSKEADSTLQMD